MWSTALIVTGIVIAVIWLLIEMKRFRHKIFAVFIVVLILLFYVSVFYVFKDRDVDLKSFDGAKEASSIYFAYLVSVFGNMKTITTNAIKMDWSANSTSLSPNVRD